MSEESLSDALDLSGIRLEKPSYVELVLSLVIVWGFGDAVSTLLAAHHAGPSLEANPWIQMLLVHEPMLVIVLKAAVVLYAGVVLLECRPLVEQVPLWRAWFMLLIGAGAAVVITNVYVGLAAI